MLTVEQEYILIESLDSPWELKEEPLYIEHDGVRYDIGHSDKELGISDRKLYSAGANGYVTTFHHRGAHEIHHYSFDLRSDAKFKNAPPNPLFVATMFHVAKKFIDDGHSVRIIAPSGSSFNKYHRIALLLGKKHKYTVGLPTVSDMPEHEGKYSQVIINNHPQNPTAGHSHVLRQINEQYIKNLDHLP